MPNGGAGIRNIVFPDWYLKLNSKYYLYQKRRPIVNIAFFFIIYFGIAYIFGTIVEQGIDVLTILIIILVMLFLFSVVYIIRCYKIVPLKISNIDEFAYLIYKISIEIKKFVIDRDIYTSIELNVDRLKKCIKKNISDLRGNQLSIDALNNLKNNLKKISAVKNPANNLAVVFSVSLRLEEMATHIFEHKNIDVDDMNDFAEGIQLIEGISLRELLSKPREYFSENFTLFCLIILAVGGIIAYFLPTHKVEFFLVILGMTGSAWLLRTFT